MGAVATTEQGGARASNIELNIVPFIDLMSCLTAFLLVTAVWVNIAQLDTHPAGKGRDGWSEDIAKLSVLVESDGVWIGVSRVNESRRIPNTPSGYDWIAVGAALRDHKASGIFEGRDDIEIAGESTAGAPVSYQAMVAAMDVAVRAGWSDVGFTDPKGLSARPVL